MLIYFSKGGLIIILDAIIKAMPCLIEYVEIQSCFEIIRW